MADLKVALEDVRDESDSRGVTAPPATTPVRVWKWSALAFAAIAAIGALAFGGWWRATRTPPEGRPLAISDQADVGRRLDRRSSDLTRWEVSHTRPTGAATTTWISGCSRFQTVTGQAHERHRRRSRAIVRGRWKPDRVSIEPAWRGRLYHPDARGRRAAARGRGFSPRFSQTDAGSRMASRNQPAAASRWPRPREPGRLHCQRLLQAQAPVWSPNGRHLLFWGQRRDAPPEHNIDWYVTAIQAGRRPDRSARRYFEKNFRRFRDCRRRMHGPRLGIAFCFMATSATPRTCGRWRSLPGVGRSAGYATSVWHN